MTKYNSVNVKLSNSQLYKLKSKIKKGTEAALNFISYVISDFNDETSFSHQFLLTERQVSRFRKVFPNNSSANIKLPKTQLSKIVHSESLLKIGLSLMKIVQGVLIPLGLIATSAANMGIPEEINKWMRSRK